MNHGSLFSGIGGFDLAASWAGIPTVWQVEKDDYCRAVLRKHFPEAKQFEDIKNVGKDQLEPVSIISGGFPCQPFSVAGKQRGTADDRYLWPEMLRVIAEVRPTWVIAENVAGIIRMELDSVLASLEAEGYTAWPLVIPACGVGAPHRRNRVWIVGYSKHDGSHGESSRSRRAIRSTSGKDETGKSERTSDVAHAEIVKDRRLRFARVSANTGASCKDASDTERIYAQRFSNGQGQIESWRSNWWTVEPDVGRTLDGFPCWLYRHIGRGMSYGESQRATEELRKLWNANVAQKIWKTVGGFDRIQQAEILFFIVREYEKSPDKTRLLLESQEALEGFVRGLWLEEKITSPSHGSGSKQQRPEQHSDPMQTLSRLLAHNRETNWQISDWEDGVPRVAKGIKNRVNRLKSLGNSIVPQVAYQIFKAIREVE